MSLPSIGKVAARLGIDVENSTPEQQKKLLVETMVIDLRDGLEYLHRKSHEADKNGGNVSWQEDPKSPLGQQLIRIHASDVFRPLAEEYCHGKKLTFVNCCKGFIGKPPENLLLEQIKAQADADPNYHC